MHHTSKTYQACFDVKYYDNFAIIGYVVFENHKSKEPYIADHVKHENIEPYVSGQFYKRELPCLLTAIEQIKVDISLIYVDANVFLGNDKKGLGWHLHNALEGKIPVIGISKSLFKESEKVVISVKRESSIKPLFVSSIGIENKKAAKMVEEMHGEFRLPDMIKLADKMSRNYFE